MSFEIIIQQFKEKSQNTESISDLDILLNQYLGKDSELGLALKKVKDIPAEERKSFGIAINEAKHQVQDAYDKKYLELANTLVENENKQPIDISYFESKNHGRLNPLTTAKWQVEDIFQKMGFEIWYPYEVDTYQNVFEYVNIPKGHPAADSWDTFYTEDGQVPITHTSSMQNRILREFGKRLADQFSGEDSYGALVPGKVFRHESVDRRHEHTFWQVEGVFIGKGIKMTDMVGILKEFARNYFGKEIEVRLNPDFFPFVEPGNNIEIRWENPSENIMKITKGTGWLEVMGAGMIHPNVLKMANIDPEVYSGFAWGCGLERVLMIKEGIDDLRLFHSGDPRFLEQF